MKLISFVLAMLATPALAATSVDAGGLVGIIIAIIVIGAICWLLWWLIGYLGIPEPFNKIARGVIAVVAVLFLINLLLSLSGSSFATFR